MTSELFTSPGIASSYHKFRPSYPGVLYDELIAFLSQGLPGPYQQAVDVGCGSGQFTEGLSSHFSRVLGIDISEAQINKTNQNKVHQNITYKVGSFEHIPLEDATCELVTSFLAAHWFSPLEKFYTEAKRVLRPGGTLAVGGYGYPFVRYQDGRHDDEMHVIFNEFLDTINKYRLEGNHQVVAHYDGWELPFEENYRCDDLNITKKMSLADFVGYLKSYSFYEIYAQKHPNLADPVDDYLKGVMEELGVEKRPEDMEVTVMWRIFYLVGRKPL